MNDSNYYSPRENYKIIIVGDHGVGKSTIIRNFLGLATINVEVTIGVEFYSYIPDEKSKFHIWDLSGHHSFNKLIETYYNNFDGLILVFDLNNRRSFENIPIWIENINKKIGNLEKKYILLLGNKIDKNNRKVSYEEANEYAQENSMLYYEISSITSIMPLTTFIKKIKIKFDKDSLKERNRCFNSYGSINQDYIKLDDKNKKCCDCTIL